MDAETKMEFVPIRGELDENFRKILQPEWSDQIIGQVEQAVAANGEKISSSIEGFRLVHAALNKLTQDFHQKCLADEKRHAALVQS